MPGSAPLWAALAVRASASAKSGFWVSGRQSLLPLANRETISTPGRDEHVALAGLDGVHGHAGGLQRRGAVAGDRRPGQVVHAEQDGDDAAHVVALLAAGQAAAEHQVVDVGRVERGHLVQRGADDGGGEVVGPEVLQRPLEGAADGGAGGGDDDGFGHGSSTMRRAPADGGRASGRPRNYSAGGWATPGAAPAGGSRRRAPRPPPRPAPAWGSPAGRRRRSSAHGPRGPVSDPRTSAGWTSVPVRLAARAAARATGRTVPRRIGRTAAVGRGGPDADGVGDRRQQHRRGLGVALRARVELVHAEHVAWSEANAGPEHRAQGHGAPAGLDDGDGLGGGHLPAPAPGQVRSGWAIGRMVPRSGQVPTTTSQPAAVSRRTGVGEVADRHGGLVRLVTSFAPIMIRATSGCSASALSTCASSSRRLARRDGQADQADGALGELGEGGGDQHARGSRWRARRPGRRRWSRRGRRRPAACRGPCRGRRCRRPRAGRPWWCGPRPCGGRRGPPRGAGRPGRPPPRADAAAAVGAQRASRRPSPSASRSLRLRSSFLSVVIRRRLSALYGSSCGPLTRWCDPAHRTRRARRSSSSTCWSRPSPT